MKLPPDQAARDAFAEELETNFSVIAAAGSGKTRAITDRIVRIACSKRATELLPKLVVVTYTNRAADEMQQRARERIFELSVPAEILVAFDRAFFGTIHSFCVMLMARHGHLLGLPPALDLLADDEEIWNDFVQLQQDVGTSLPPENRAALLRHVELRRLMELSRRADIVASIEESGPCPKIDLTRIIEFSARGSAIDDAKHAAQQWQEALGSDADFIPLPDCRSKAPAFCAAWRETFEPLREWLSKAAIQLAAEVARSYRDYRIDRGVGTFGDQISIADELLANRETADRIRSEDFHVILDEAQDTSPSQFSVLIETTRPPGAAGRWIETAQSGPRAGHFCMVGDLQQSIYSDTGALPRYQRVHAQLIATGQAKALTFAATFRLDDAALALVNATFRELLHGRDGQVTFVELQPRPDRLPGQVLRLELAPRAQVEPGAKILQHVAAGEEAELLAEWLCQSTLETLRARSWRHVAVLCPRKAWLQTLQAAFERRGLCAEVYSEKALNADSPTHSWFAALLTIMAQPSCGYEIVGVLREIFGVSDDAMAKFSRGDGERFQIASPPASNGVVESRLRLLSEIHSLTRVQPLFSAVRDIVERTSLCARLRALPAEDVGNSDDELQALLNAAAEAEAEGQSLSEFADWLRTNLGAKRELTAQRGDAIQLLTSHMAKGSEWDAVIVPYLSHGVTGGRSQFPRLISLGEDSRPIIALDKYDLTPETKSALARGEQQNLERLLYVALTRAKHSLVLVDDRQLFAPVQKRKGSESQLERFRAESGGVNAEVFSGLGDKATECSLTAAMQKADAIRLGGFEVAAPSAVSSAAIASAKKNAARFIRKRTPSQFSTREILPDRVLAVAAEDGHEAARRAAGDAAMQYGTAWHQFAEQVVVAESEAAREAVYENLRKVNPDSARFAREWLLLRPHFDSGSGFLQRLHGATSVIHPEFPILWRASDDMSVEGMVDLALYDGVSRWLLLDWKTNRVDDLKLLKATYRPQIAAYWKALTAMTAQTVEAALYSTVTGELASYTPHELNEAWNEIAGR